MHILVALIILLFIAIEFFAQEAVPVAFKLAFWGLPE
jgi:hypothetical protein